MEYAQYDAQYRRYLELTEKALRNCCDAFLPETAEICRAARYSLLSGGKRVRAVLTLSACELCGETAESAADYAAALEMLHCYSLIHDDLPCMDNDDYRRGKSSCHRKFGEATALLAADALVTAAFEVIANAPLPAQSRADAAAILAKGAGARGMLYGQELDKRYEKEPADANALLALHKNKTGALILAGVQLGCAAATAGGADQCRPALEAYAQALGLAFQIIDDILDVTSTTGTLGKPVGSDEENGKTTFVTLYGLTGARARAQEQTLLACEALSALSGRPAAGFLTELAQQLAKRKK